MAFNIKTGERRGPGYSRSRSTTKDLDLLDKHREIFIAHVDHQTQANNEDFCRRFKGPLVDLIRKAMLVETPLRKDCPERLDSLVQREDWGIVFASKSDYQLMEEQINQFNEDVDTWRPFIRELEGAFDALISMDSPAKKEHPEALLAIGKQIIEKLQAREKEGLLRPRSPRTPR